MENLPTWLLMLMAWLALPQFGLSTVFVISIISATLLPLGSEPAVFGLIKLNPDLFWPAILVATAGNTIGGAIDWWMGYGAHSAVDKYKGHSVHLKALQWLEKLGPKACASALLALRGLYADWQIFALSGDDDFAAQSVSGRAVFLVSTT
jgi:membrane protein YqaA with SNARE-associated domain